MAIVFSLFLLFVSSCYGAKVSSKAPYLGDHLTIHIVGHTHDDPGWIITADDYYIQEVQWIFYTIIPILKTNKARKFTYVEMAYMHRWWLEISDELKQDTINLINNGQLQINLGGWCMNDEANPTASSIIHQMTDGNQFVLNNFGNIGRPKVAWHIDPFGHSWITAGLWAQAGFDAFGIHRIDYLNLEERKLSRNLEFIWNGSSSLGEDGFIFAHILDDGYGSPGSIQFWDGRSWINTDPLLPSYPPNAHLLAEEFIASARERSLNYKHNQILIPFGSDFAHQNAYQSYIQMDKLMDYVNNNSTYNVSLIYSTLSDYVIAVNKLNLTWKIEQPDFFTYASEAHQYWSGYFTSRPILKLYVRSRENDLRVAEQYYVFAKNLGFKADYQTGMKNISFLREAIDVAQHHDAITGTEKDDVTTEYMNQLKEGTIKMDDWAVSVVGQFLKKSSSAPEPQLQRGGIGELLEQLTAGKYIVMVAYNSLAWTVTEYLKVPTNRSDLIVYDVNSNIVPSQINDVATGEQESEYPSDFSLYIKTTMKPLAFETMFIGVATKEHPATVGKLREIAKGESITIGDGGGYYSITFDETNRLSQITNNNISQSFSVKNEWNQYVSSGGAYGDNLPNSGAYIFRPSQDNRYRLGLQDHYRYTIDNILFRQDINTQDNYGFLTTPHSGRDYAPETFVSSICDINNGNGSFSFSFDIVSGFVDGWYQRPYIDFAAYDINDDEYGHGLFAETQRGSKSIKPTRSGDDELQVKITFDTPYTDVPEVLVSIRKTDCNDKGQYVATIASITTDGATLYVKRVEEEGTDWTNTVYVDWVSYDPTTREQNELRTHGTKIVSIKDDIHVVHPFVVELKLPKYSFIPEEPVLLVSLQQIDPAIGNNVYFYGYTTYLSTNESFLLNLYPFNGFDRKNNITLKLSYWAFERNVLKYNVTEDTNIVNKLVTGSLMDEMQQEFRSGYSQTWRVFKTMDRDLAYIDNRVHLGPIDQGMEFVTRFKTELDNDLTWFTNQNGLEYVDRRYLSWRDERIAANYFPSTGQTFMRDINTNIKFSTIVNQGHGVGSTKSGEYEIMLQRRCLADDHKGVNEVLNTTSHTEPQIMILMDKSDNVADLNRKLYQIQQFSHTYFFGTNIINSIEDYTNTYNTSWTAMNSKNSNGLPEQIMLMQLRYGYSGTRRGDNYLNDGIILQLQNMFEKREGTVSKNISIDLNSIINNDIINIQNSTEMTLTSNLPLSELHRLSWNVEMNDGEIRTIRSKQSEDKRRKLQRIKDQDPTINVSPREIRTFVLNSVIQN